MLGKRLSVGLALSILSAIILMWPFLSGLFFGSPGSAVEAQQSCLILQDPKNVPSPVVINFDDLADSTVIGSSYLAAYGVSFENSRITQAVIVSDPTNAHSSPNFAFNNAPVGATSAGVPMRISFASPKSHVGFWLGNGSGQQISALVTAYDANNGLLCETVVSPVPEAHTAFVGFSTGTANIAQIMIDYGDTSIGEAIDDLIFNSDRALPTPTRTAMPTWTPIPSPMPTSGPAPTATPIVPMFAYHPVEVFKPVILPILPDFAIHGIEITQGIQCFDTSKGLSGCTDNSLPVVTKKDTTARIYLKANNAYSNYSSIPVRLHIYAAGVWYTANASGKPTISIDQSKNDSADIYFNVNFSSDVPVSFYAEVDPDNLYAETSESNNRFPTAGNINLNFRTRSTMKIVGQRLRYHPSGYSGSQYAGGWAVNGGAADWFEQVLPMRNNSINYSVKSGYLNWTTSLGSGDGQHALIQTLNSQWMLENIFSFWFSGPFTGARHVYGWAPSAGYGGGHADMPVYPHAGGLGVVGIGSDAAGTSTDNPGSGTLIFGHELVHDYNVYHTNTADGCGSNDSGSDFPYSSSSIQEFGFNPITGKIYNPANTHDLMSYCPSGGSKLGWISPFTWNKMFFNLAPAAAPALAPSDPADRLPILRLAATGALESLQVNATIYNPSYKPDLPGKLGNLYKAEGGIAYLLPQGPYAIQLRNSLGEPLATYPFVVNFESEYDAHDGPGNTAAGVNQNDPPPFPPNPTKQEDVSFIVPWDPATVSVALLYNQSVLDEKTVSPNAPQVLITAPSGQENWLAGSTHTLKWQGSDLDGDLLTYAVFYSRDGGSTWDLIASDLTDTWLDLPTDSLAGGSDVRFRVVVTDGINTGYDETDEAISVPNKLPEVTILNPVGGQNFLPGELVVLQGIGVDFEDGTLPDENLSWKSSLQGGLGHGPSLALNVLKPGWHTITLTVEDSFAIKQSASVQIYIGYHNFLPVIRR